MIEKQNSPEQFQNWIDNGVVKGRYDETAQHPIWQFEISEVSSQSKVYKQALHHFFRQSMNVSPQSGEFEIEIKIYTNPNYPAIDVDNVAKAILDGVKGHIFHDDCQIMRLLVEKVFSQVESVIFEIIKRP